MKNYIFLYFISALLVISNRSHSQHTIVYTGEKNFKVDILNYDSATISTRQGWVFNTAEIDSVVFSLHSIAYDRLYRLLTHLDIPFSFIESPMKNQLLTTHDQQSEIYALRTSIEAFRKTRQTAYTFKAIGIVMIGIGWIVTANDFYNNSGYILLLGGTVSSLSGFVIDFGAGEKLRIR